MRETGERPIGVLDTGVGGLTVLSALRDAFPREDFVYLGDSARNPYGPLPPHVIQRQAGELVDWLLQRDVQAIVLACNTITVAAQEVLAQQAAPIPVFGMGLGAARALEKSRNGRIGIMATLATIDSHRHREALYALRPDGCYVEQACPDLAATIEQGIVHGARMDALLHRYLQPFLEAEVDTIIEGCTHYPLIYPRLRALTEGRIYFLNPAQDTVERVEAWLSTTATPSHRGRRGAIDLYFTAAHPVQQRLADRCLGEGQYRLHHVTLAEGVAL